MPFFKITSNVEPKIGKQTFLTLASQYIAELLGKSEKFVMVELNTNINMSFNANNSPIAFVELKSINLPVDGTKALSQDICQFLKNNFNIEMERIYIEFTDVERNKWGWNGTTFEK